MPSVAQKLFAEGVGTTLLLAIVVGSGIMGDTLSNDDAVALLGNTLATGAGLVVLIMMFGPVSGAHFNPVVTLAFLLRGGIGLRLAGQYLAVQVVGAILGVWLAHLMFDIDLWQASSRTRSSLGQTVGEIVATFSLVLVILRCVKLRPDAVPYAVGLVITAGYWFTSSTSFANPAVTLARALSDTFAGIQPASVLMFIVGQIIGTLLALGAERFLERKH